MPELWEVSSHPMSQRNVPILGLFQNTLTDHSLYILQMLNLEFVFLQKFWEPIFMVHKYIY